MRVLALMKDYGVRSFRDGWHKRQFEAAAASCRKQRYYRRYHVNSKRECQRRRLADAHQRQLNSHKSGTLQPAHIFGFAKLYDTCCTCCVEPWLAKKFRQAGGALIEACVQCHSLREHPGPKEGAV